MDEAEVGEERGEEAVISGTCIRNMKVFIVVFLHLVARYLFGSVEMDGRSCGVGYKMFTRTRCHYRFRLNWPSSSVLNVQQIALLHENCCPSVMMVAAFKINSRPFRVYLLVEFPLFSCDYVKIEGQ
jgi:hypothetical protein